MVTTGGPGGDGVGLGAGAPAQPTPIVQPLNVWMPVEPGFDAKEAAAPPLTPAIVPVATVWPLVTVKLPTLYVPSTVPVVSDAAPVVLSPAPVKLVVPVPALCVSVLVVTRPEAV